LRTCGLELTFQNGAKVLLGRKGNRVSSADIPFAVKKIEYFQQYTQGSGDKYRNIIYYGEDGKKDSHTLWNPLDVAVSEQMKDIPDGYEWVGYSLTLDSEGFIVCANMLLWPTGTVPHF
jgi:hypothetical protein